MNNFANLQKLFNEIREFFTLPPLLAPLPPLPSRSLQNEISAISSNCTEEVLEALTISKTNLNKIRDFWYLPPLLQPIDEPPFKDTSELKSSKKKVSFQLVSTEPALISLSETSDLQSKTVIIQEKCRIHKLSKTQQISNTSKNNNGTCLIKKNSKTTNKKSNKKKKVKKKRKRVLNKLHNKNSEEDTSKTEANLDLKSLLNEMCNYPSVLSPLSEFENDVADEDNELKVLNDKLVDKFFEVKDFLDDPSDEFFENRELQNAQNTYQEHFDNNDHEKSKSNSTEEENVKSYTLSNEIFCDNKYASFVTDSESLNVSKFAQLDDEKELSSANLDTSNCTTRVKDILFNEKSLIELRCFNPKTGNWSSRNLTGFVQIPLIGSEIELGGIDTNETDSIYIGLDELNLDSNGILFPSMYFDCDNLKIPKHLYEHDYSNTIYNMFQPNVAVKIENDANCQYDYNEHQTNDNFLQDFENQSEFKKEDKKIWTTTIVKYMPDSDNESETLDIQCLIQERNKREEKLKKTREEREAVSYHASFDGISRQPLFAKVSKRSESIASSNSSTKSRRSRRKGRSEETINKVFKVVNSYDLLKLDRKLVENKSEEEKGDNEYVKSKKPKRKRGKKTIDEWDNSQRSVLSYDTPSSSNRSSQSESVTMKPISNSSRSSQRSATSSVSGYSTSSCSTILSSYRLALHEKKEGYLSYCRRKYDSKKKKRKTGLDEQEPDYKQKVLEWNQILDSSAPATPLTVVDNLETPPQSPSKEVESAFDFDALLAEFSVLPPLPEESQNTDAQQEYESLIAELSLCC